MILLLGQAGGAACISVEMSRSTLACWGNFSPKPPKPDGQKSPVREAAVGGYYGRLSPP